ncbi:MAG: superoxide dismutase, partial [Lewinella sp.]|nr:superoxide dismutase [Lewinella sp.]
MNKRTFLKYSGLMSAAALMSPLTGWARGLRLFPSNAADAFTLPELGYDYAALEPAIDAMTMRIHHSRHHAGYVNKLNQAVAGTPLAEKSIRKLMAVVSASDPAVRNNGGGHFNHSLFWKILTPEKGTQPAPDLQAAIDRDFGSLDALKTQLLTAATSRFGSGWAWLSVDRAGTLFVSSTPNQDNPLMTQVVERAGYPILGLDVWEHAYYLKYQNMRGDYLQALWGILNWDEISRQ